MMRTRYLLAATAASAMVAAAPAYGQAAPTFPGGISTSYTNNSVSNFSTTVLFGKRVALEGTVALDGEVDASSAATADNNGRQQLNNLDVEGDGPDTIAPINIGGSGNIGVNLAAGLWNAQLNSAALAVSNNIGVADPSESAGGWADATTSSLQTLNALNEGADSAGENETSGANNVTVANISGTGNIGVNAAAGMFNEQSNLMTLASANNSTLAEAQAEVVQLASNSAIGDQTNPNNVNPGVIGNGTNGNIGVNVAAGFGNQQANALTVASSSGNGSGATPPTPTPGGQ